MSPAAPGSLVVMTSYDMVIALPTADRSRAHAFALALGLETPGELAEDGVPDPLRARQVGRVRPGTAPEPDQVDDRHPC
jgi:hypothetical protein